MTLNSVILALTVIMVMNAFCFVLGTFVTFETFEIETERGHNAKLVLFTARPTNGQLYFPLVI